MRVWQHDKDGKWRAYDDTAGIVAWLRQFLLLYQGESPVFATAGLPYQRIFQTGSVSQVVLQRIQQQFAPYFASLRLEAASNPVGISITATPLDPTAPVINETLAQVSQAELY